MNNYNFSEFEMSLIMRLVEIKEEIENRMNNMIENEEKEDF